MLSLHLSLSAQGGPSASLSCVVLGSKVLTPSLSCSALDPEMSHLGCHLSNLPRSFGLWCTCQSVHFVLHEPASLLEVEVGKLGHNQLAYLDVPVLLLFLFVTWLEIAQAAFVTIVLMFAPPHKKECLRFRNFV